MWDCNNQETNEKENGMLNAEEAKALIHSPANSILSVDFALPYNKKRCSIISEVCNVQFKKNLFQ